MDMLIKMRAKNLKISAITEIIVLVIFLDLVNCLTIDNQLTVVRNDCYERLAIGEKLNSKDVDKTLMVNSVQECQMACTQEEKKCRSFSIGIGVKGNHTCQLSKSVIKETPDLKPIGTVSDVEFDLYIKKLGCKLVIPKDPTTDVPPLPEKPSPYDQGQVNKEPTYPTRRPTSTYEQSKPEEDGYIYNKPSYYSPLKPAEDSYNKPPYYGPPKPAEDNYNKPTYYGPPKHSEDSYNKPPYYGPVRPTYAPDKPYRVQSSMISVASNPNAPPSRLPPPSDYDRSYDYRPYRYGSGRPYYPNRFDELDLDRPPSYYDYRDDRPPFRPPFLNHPYESRYRPDWYDSERNNDRIDSGRYGHGSRPNRPNDIPERPLSSDNYDYRPIKRPEPPRDYGSSPNRPFFIPERPGTSDRYGSEARPPLNIPDRPDSNKRPSDNSNNEYQYRPQRPDRIPDPPVNDYNSRPIRPSEIPGRPLSDSNGYESETRPQRPDNIPERPIHNSNEYIYGPFRPDRIPERPLSDSQSYGQGSRPSRPEKIPERPLDNFDGYGSGRPHRPHDVPKRPVSNFGGYGSRPDRPDDIPERPLADFDGYGSRPNRPNDIPERPLGDSDAYGLRPNRPNDIPERPYTYPERPYIYDDRKPQRPQRPPRPEDETFDYNSRPHRPDYIPERPLRDPPIYGSEQRPPYKIPERPSAASNNYGQESRPHRPQDIPERPLSDGGSYGVESSRPDRIPERPRPSHPFGSIGYGPTALRPFYEPVRTPYYGYRRRPYYRSRYPPPNLYEREFERTENFSDAYGKANADDTPSLNVSNSKNGNDRSSNNTSTISNSSIGLESSNSTEQAAEHKSQPPHRKPIVTETVGPNGQTITSIITEIKEACFRRVLAGKRVIRAFVRRAVPCERVEDCQRECSDEKRFVCEGFNYRLDPTGRGQGDCELIDLPLSRLDIRRDVYDDPDYDYYERDRNNDAPDCKGHRFYGSYGSSDGGGYYSDNRYDYYDHHGHGGGYYDDYRGGGYDHDRRPLRPIGGYDDDGGYRPYDNNRRGGYDYHHNYQDDYDKSYGYHYKYHHSGDDRYEEHSSHGYRYPRPPPDDYEYKPHYPPPPYDYKSYEPYLPLDYWDRERGEHWKKYFEERLKDKEHWGFKNGYYNGWGSYGGAYGNFGAPDSYYSNNYGDDRYKNSNRYDYDYYDKKYFYVPRDNGDSSGSKDWGRYGGSYGYGGQGWSGSHNNHRDSYDYWGFNRLGSGGNGDTGLLPPYQEKPDLNGNYLPPYDDRYDYYENQHHHGGHEYNHHHEHHDHTGHTEIYIGQGPYHDYIRDECSLRMVTGFRLHKGIVKKLIGVPNIYECELLCFKERDFPCNSFAFKYTTVPDSAPENCYLSDRDYKELDYYTDLEPDRDCDIYTMHNRNKCGQSTVLERYNSDCFWRVRSGQRLDQRVVRDSLNVKSIVNCQLECLRSHIFTCRAFSFRYGSPVIGGAIDNCQLTDLPFSELDPRIHLVPESGFELYERGSYGHGCEPNHFYIGSKPEHHVGEKLDQLCYIGYGSPARLLPQATKKSIRVETEAECKAECTHARDKSLFQCMSLSFQTLALKGSPNCDLSDIVQRDLLSNVDYVPDPDSWLFAWDIHNPRCASVINIGIGGGSGGIGGGSGGIGGGSGGVGGGNIIGGGKPPPIGGGTNVIGGGDEQEYEHGNTRYPHDHYPPAKGVLVPWFSPGYTWRIYSVGGLPCRRGSLCQENKVAGFWYCELEGREEHAWDYCCRPDHQCGYSEGFPYQWCYVGPGRTQWRNCNDRYYPYTSNDRFDQPHHHSGSYLPEVGYPSGPAWSSSNSIGSNHVSDMKPPRPAYRPDRPPVQLPPTLEDYESPQHDNHFLDPPKPGGFGQSRHWPLSYLHKEMPPNETSPDPNFDFVKVPKGRNIDSQYEAIANLIDTIKSNDPKGVPYQVANTTDDEDDILYVQIPLPTNFSTDLKSEKLSKKEVDVPIPEKLETVDLLYPSENRNSTKRSNQRLSRTGRLSNFQNVNATDSRRPHLYTRSYITKTNRTAINNQRRTRGNVEMLTQV